MPCSNCMAEYTKFRKEHGCSKCAYSFCQKCVSKKCVIPGLSSQPVSVCDSCYAQLTGQAFTPGPNLNKPTDRFERKPGGPKPKNWWGDDDLPPPSMRRDYMKPQPRLVPKNNGGGGGGGSKVEADMNEIHNRFAKLQNKPVEEVKDPRILITGKDENGQVPTGAKVLDSFKEDKPTTSNESAPKTDQAKSITVEEIEERLAALRGVPVIRKPRLMVVDDDEEDDVEMPDEAVQLLKEAEKAAIKRKAPSSAYDNHGMQTGEENDMAENRESTTFKKILKECEDTPSVASSISSYNPLPNFAEQCRQVKQEALEADRQATLFIQQSEQIPSPAFTQPSETTKPGPSEPKSPETPRASQQKKHGGFFAKLFKSHSKDNV